MILTMTIYMACSACGAAIFAAGFILGKYDRTNRTPKNKAVATVKNSAGESIGGRACRELFNFLNYNGDPMPKAESGDE